MRPLLPLLALVLGLVACSGRVATTVPTPWSPSLSEPAPALHAQLLELVNEARATPTTCGDTGTFASAPTLTLDGRLSAAAQLHSEEMWERGVMSHVGANGSSVAERVTRQGYDWRSVGENVASGFESAEHVVRAWLESPGHCANIMAADYVHLGVGREDLYWTQVFGRPR